MVHFLWRHRGVRRDAEMHHGEDVNTHEVSTWRTVGLSVVLEAMISQFMSERQ